MPVATEVLNEDIKELKDDIHQLALGLTELRTDFRAAYALAKYIGTILVAMLLTSGVGAIIWGASLSTKVYWMEFHSSEKFQDIEKRIDKLETGVEKRIDKLEISIDARFQKMEASNESRFQKMEAKFDRLETTILKAFEQPRPATPKPNP